MVRVKLLTRMAGPKGNREPGTIVDLPYEEANQLIKGGYAQDTFNAAPKSNNEAENSAKPKDETASVNPKESAAVRTAKPEDDELVLKHLGSGMFNVVDNNGDAINDKPLKKKEAQAIIDGK